MTTELINIVTGVINNIRDKSECKNILCNDGVVNDCNNCILENGFPLHDMLCDKLPYDEI